MYSKNGTQSYKLLINYLIFSYNDESCNFNQLVIILLHNTRTLIDILLVLILVKVFYKQAKGYSPRASYLGILSLCLT